MWLQPTSPFRGTRCISSALRLIEREDVKAVVGCISLDRDESLMFRTQGEFLAPLSPDHNVQTSRHSIRPLLTPNGAMYLIRTEAIKTLRSFYFPDAVPVIMDKLSSLDLDEEIDWKIAEAYLACGLVEELRESG